MVALNFHTTSIGIVLMGESLTRRWNAVRELREQWAVPFNLLDRVMGRVTGTCACRAEKENWQDSATADLAADANCQHLVGSSSVGLHRQLAEAFQEQLARFQTEDQSSDAEKRARALSILADLLAKLLKANGVTGNDVSHVSGMFDGYLVADGASP